MKKLLVLAFAVLALLVAALDPSAAQMPFSSTSPPNSNPFGKSNGFAPLPSATPYGGARQAYPGAAAATAAVPVAYSPQAISPDHKLQRGDHLSYRVQEDRDDKVVPLVVTDSGELDIPLIGRVKAVGKTTTQLSGEVKSELEREYYYHATVVLGLDFVAPEVSPGRVFVTGAVKNGGGALEIPPGATLTASEAIAQSGGPSDFADLKHVIILRHGATEKSIQCDVGAVFKGQTNKDVVLQPDDTVRVKENMLNLRF